MAKITGKGSFAGVPFLIEESQSVDGGRRLVKHEYPLRDDGLTEDLGKKLRSYNISCLVIGDDHIKQAEKLIKALEKGKGELKHPYFKNINVLVDSYKANYSTAHQRVTRFDISFTPDIQKNAPESAKNTLFSALQKYTDAINALADDFANVIDEINEFIDLLVDNPLTQLIDTAISFVENVFESINSVVANVDSIKQKVFSFKGRITGLINQPHLLAQNLQGLVSSDSVSFSHSKSSAFYKKTLIQQALTASIIEDSVNNFISNKKEIPKTVFSSMLLAKRNNLMPNEILKRYASGLHQQEIAQSLMIKMQFSLARLIVSTMTVEYAKSVVLALSDSLDSKTPSKIIAAKSDIERLIHDIDEKLEQVILTNADAENWYSYQALEHFRLSVITDLRTRGNLLANAKQVVLKDTFPAIVVQYQHSGDSQTWQELSERNDVVHPLFCTGGNEIEVLQ